MKKNLIIAIVLLFVALNSNIFCFDKQLNELETLEDFIEFIKVNAPSEDAFLAVQRLSAYYIKEKDWDNAIQWYELYKSSFPGMGSRFNKIIGLLSENDSIMTITSIKNINTESEEAFPVPSADGKVLYFASDRPGGIGGEDIYYSVLKNNEWQSPKLLPGNINTIYTETPKSISSDGNKLVIFGNFYDSYGSGDMWYIEKTKSGWSNKMHFPEPINTQYFDGDGSFTSDGRAFIFSTDRPGGVGEYHAKGSEFHGWIAGNIDLWVCIKNENGWSEAINLGSVINTPYAERSPFLHPDGKTLYFVSDGHYGLGLCDVFRSVRLSDSSWTEWSEPVNLGKNINSCYNDEWFVITTDGKYAYYSSYKNNNQIDIYKISLPKSIDPERNVATVNGKVIDKKTGKPILQAEIKWVELKTGEILNQDLSTNPQTGEFFIVLPVGKNYAYYADKPGYFSESEHLDLTGIKKNITKEINIKLIPEPEIQGCNITFQLNNIYFDFDSASLKQESFWELNRVIDFLKDAPNCKIQINGHTDSIGTKEYDQLLSERRAKSVKNYLVSNGITESRIITKGYGEKKPIASNETEEGRERNRRVEFILKKK
ncbi:MAG: OmpA family protein [Bacteroidetes bacterium]|nr:OmpA family protein [Bacteroidota bacterium]